MTRGRAHALIAATTLAVVVTAMETFGWLGWQALRATAAVNPEETARLLAEGRSIMLPPLVVRSRRLATRDLGGARTATLASAISRVGRLQRAWLPADPIGWVNLAREELVRGRARESIEALAAALQRDPTSPSLHRLQALFFFSVGDRSSALGDLAVAAAIAPGLRVPEVELSAADERLVQLEGLRLRASYYPRRRTETALALARELRASGDDQGARALLGELRGRADVEIELARWKIEEGDYEGACELLLPIASRRTQARSVRARAWSVVATARDLAGDAEGALSAASAALELDPGSAATFITLAGLAQGRGDLDGALEHLRRAWGMRPADTALLVRIAAVAEQAGKPADALLALERAVEIDPGNPRLAGLLVELQMRSGRYSEAAVSLSRALDRHPTDADLLRLADRLPREVGIR